MKVLASNSPLNFLPIELGKKQLLLLDSLRFTLEMIDYNFNQLETHLELISKDQANKIHYIVFNHAWNLIDHTQRFYSLYKKLNPKSIVIQKLDYVYVFRNAIQHLHQNIEDRIIERNRPIYGFLKWVVSDEIQNKVFTSILVSGIYNYSSVEFKQPAQSGYTKFINEVMLETDTWSKKEENEINLSRLMEDIHFLTLQLEESLMKVAKEQNLTLGDWNSMKDIRFNMINNTAIRQQTD